MTLCSRSSSSARAWRLDAAATSEANEILRRHGLPEVNTRVVVSDPEGNARSGFVADAFSEENTEFGIADEGVKIVLDDGTMLEEFIAQLDRTGIQIAALPSETSVKEGEGAPLVGEEAPALPDHPPARKRPYTGLRGWCPRPKPLSPTRRCSATRRSSTRCDRISRSKDAIIPHCPDNPVI